jgi:hypothetical protein
LPSIKNYENSTEINHPVTVDGTLIRRMDSGFCISCSAVGDQGLIHQFPVLKRYKQSLVEVQRRDRIPSAE